MQDGIVKLASGFECGDLSQWQNMAEKALRGADFDTLERTSEDGIKRGPLFTQAPQTHFDKAHTPHLAGRPWHICAMIDHPDIVGANHDILNALKGGASALSLIIDPSGLCGIALRSIADIERLLSGVYETLIPIHITPSPNDAAAALFAAYFKDNTDVQNIHLSLGYVPGPKDNDTLMSIAAWTHDNAPHWKAVCINGAALHEDGASAAQELAFMAAQLVSYLRVLLEKYDIDTALSMIDVRLAADQDAHFNIVKFRAAQLIWAQIAREFDAKNTAMSLHVISSMRMMAKEDPWANLLRLNAACFGAVCGRAGTITLLPFTHIGGETVPDLAAPFAHRLSRNIQLLQMEESHLGHVEDPACGSYTHESLTHNLAAKSWNIFQNIEARGGWFKAFDWFFKTVKKMEKQRNAKIENGEILRVGINQFVKADVRKTKTIPRPKIKPRTGNIIEARNFEQAIKQAKNGCLSPLIGGR
ncbi:MAG: methylmalonyl-CoA mutase family protein [Robiginitomaculum sp.]